VFDKQGEERDEDDTKMRGGRGEEDGGVNGVELSGGWSSYLLSAIRLPWLESDTDAPDWPCQA
jgi:hypothetical protein